MQQQQAQVIPAIYASTSGNTEWVVEQVANVWRNAGTQVDLHRAEQTDPSILQHHATFLFATSTWDHGEINPFFKKIFDAFKEIDCHGKRAAFIGMGDVRYEPVLFCGGMEQLKNRWVERGGTAVGVPLKINGDPFAKFDAVIKPWADKQLVAIQQISLGSNPSSGS